MAVKEYRDLTDGEVPRRFIKIVLSVLTASEVLGIVHHNDLRSLARAYGELRAAPHLIGRTGNDLAVLHSRGVKVPVVKRRHAFWRRDRFVHNIDAKVDSRISVIGNGHRISVFAFCRGHSRRAYIFAVRCGSDVFVADIHRLTVFGRLDRICARFTVCISERGSDGLARSETHFAGRSIFTAARRRGDRLDGIGSGTYPLIFDGRGVALVSVHPAFSIFGAAPMVEHYATGRGRQTGIFMRSCLFGVHTIYRHAVNIPGYGVLFPKEAVSVEIFGSVEAEVVHILMLAAAVGIIVELNFRGIFAEELDVYLVPRMEIPLFVILPVRTGIRKEGARRTGVVARLHANGIVTVVIPHIGTKLRAVIIAPLRLGTVGDLAYLHPCNVVDELDVLGVPFDVEYRTVAVAVTRVNHVFVRAVRKIRDLLDLEFGGVLRHFRAERRTAGRIAAACDGDRRRECENEREDNGKDDILYLVRFHFHSSLLEYFLYSPARLP